MQTYSQDLCSQPARTRAIKRGAREPIVVPAHLYQEERTDLHVSLAELPSETELEGESHFLSRTGGERLHPV